MSEVTKRSVSTDALETLGTIIGDNEKRDAIHLAVLPVRAGARLHAGQPISLVSGAAVPDAHGLGIVDPFLAVLVEPEQMFWMVLRPRLVTSLRHVWSHPAFPDEPITGSAVATADQSAAMAVIALTASRIGVASDELIDHAHRFLDSDEYWVDGGRFEDIYLSSDDPFWSAFETATGRKVPSDDRNNFFSCAC